MYAQLGNIQFDLITYFDGINDTVSFNYAEHERINNKPLLQYLGENLQEITIKLNFHTSFCNPEEELQKLKECAGFPQKFIKGNGEYIGAYVINEITKTIEQTSNEGDLVSLQVELRLKEFTGKIQENNKQEKGLKRRK